LPFSSWDQLPDVLPYLGVARVKLGVWTTDGDVESAEGFDFPRLLERLRDERIVPTACLVAPPPKIAAAIGGNTWPHLLKAPPSSWQPQLAFLVSRYSGYLDRWQLGTDADALQVVNAPLMRQTYDVVLNQFSKLVARPDLAMPWPAWFDVDGRLPATVALSIPSDVLPHQVPLYLRDVKQSPDQQVSLSLQTLSISTYGRPAQIRDFVQRCAYALSAGAERIDLPLPFDITRDPSATTDANVTTQPRELLLVMRTLLSTLGNTTYKGRVQIDPDVEAFLFEKSSSGDGVLLVWSKSPAGPDKTIPIVLGNAPQRVDVFGNVSDVLRPRDVTGTTDVVVGAEPAFIIGIDAKLAQFRSSFAFDNATVESSFQAHQRVLQFTNAYPLAISGRIKLTGPTGWTVSTTQSNFNLAPGETYRGPVNIEFPYNSFAGDKAITVDVELQADRAHKFKVFVPMKLGLGDVGMETIALRDGPDLIVQQMITNYTQQPIDYTAFIIYPGQPRQERLLTALKPGITTIKKYRLTNLTPKPGITLRSGVRETEGTRVLNEEVTVQ